MTGHTVNEVVIVNANQPLQCSDECFMDATLKFLSVHFLVEIILKATVVCNLVFNCFDHWRQSNMANQQGG